MVDITKNFTIIYHSYTFRFCKVMIRLTLERLDKCKILRAKNKLELEMNSFIVLKKLYLSIF